MSTVLYRSFPSCSRNTFLGKLFHSPNFIAKIERSEDLSFEIRGMEKFAQESIS
jgi:hypothetical protein